MCRHRSIAIIIAIATALSSGCAGLAGSAGPAGPPRVTFIHGARVFDGEKLLPPTNVVLRDGVIAAVGDQVAAPPGAEVVEGQGRTLLPGLIDAHTHVWDASQLRQAAALGVTTELDLMGDWKLDATLKARAKEDASMADLRSAGNPATSPRGHGTEYGLPLATLERPEEAEAFVAARVKEGSDYLKIVYEPGRLPMTSLDRATMEACVEAAHRHGLLAVVHVSKLEAAREALAAGADGLAHVWFDEAATEEVVALAAAKGAFVIPTLSVTGVLFDRSQGPAILADGAFAPFIGAAGREMLRTPLRWKGAGGGLERAERSVAMLAARGVPVLAGSDAPNPGTAHGATVHEEMKNLVAAGLSPVDALAAATSRPAARFHLGDRGRIAPGLRADLLLVQGDPAADISATRRIEVVWRGGVRVDREAQRRAVAAEQAQAAKPAAAAGALVSDFEGGDFKASFGAGWMPSTDALFNGKSIGTVALASDGAAGTRGSLQITGEVRAGFAFPWSGAMFHPGPQPMAPADLSAARGFSFYARGDGGTYRVMVFSRSRGGRPSTYSFVAGAKWTQFHLTWRGDFDGLDGRDVMGIAWVAGPKTGTFRFQLDQVAMEGPGGGPVALGSGVR